MSMAIRVVAAAVCLALLGVAAQAQDLQRGLRNYQEILAGRKTMKQLSPPEVEEVIRVHRIVQANRAGGGGNSTTKSSQCRDARDEARSKASDLADYAKKLRNCAEAGDLSDDCETEFRRTKNAFEDYESAVSDVESECN